jgi:hypothetical protein
LFARQAAFRCTDDPAILASTLVQGWTYEGDIQTKVFACIPPPWRFGKGRIVRANLPSDGTWESNESVR